MKLAEKIYAELTARGVDVILDDRDERPGVKFKDADLVGFPIRIGIGEKSLAKGEVEIKPRNGAIQFVKTENAVETVAALIANAASDGLIKRFKKCCSRSERGFLGLGEALAKEQVA